MLTLGKYSFGLGDRFARQGVAQLRACIQAQNELGVALTPVWNKSCREHLTIGSEPAETRAEADEAVRSLGWTGAYHVDADHINRENVAPFIDHCDFFTLDVAAFIGRPPEPSAVDDFVDRHPELAAPIAIEGLDEPFTIENELLLKTAHHYLSAIQEAGKIYRHVSALRGSRAFITEVSIDETEDPQTPPVLLIILAALADEGIPLQTIAPKFSGRFNKGVDYIGDFTQFDKEFRADLAVIRHAVRGYALPENLKLSVHSGSDKFSLYPIIGRRIREYDAGLHVKTAGTTWLEELIGLAEADGEGLALAKEIYGRALADRAKLCAPYSTVIAIDPEQLPTVKEVARWQSEDYVKALRHDLTQRAFNPHFRQLLHVGYKIAAELGGNYLDRVEQEADIIGRNVSANLYERHLRPLFAAGGN